MRLIERKTKQMLSIEQEKRGDIEEILRVLYVDENKSIYEIMKTLNISYATCIKWLKLAGIYSRKLDIEGDT